MFVSLVAIAMAITGAVSAPTSNVANVVSVPFGIGIDPFPKENEHFPLLTTLEIGSQKEKVQVAFDTGSFDLWVPLPTAEDYLTKFGTYNPSDSSSAVDIHKQKEVGYVSGSASVDFYNDTLVLQNGISISSGTVGVTNHSAINYPVLGIGSAEQDFGPAIISNLKADGKIKTNVVSIYASNNFDGEVLFGGIDHAKYEGDLYTNKINGFGFTGTNFTILGETHEFNSKVVVDSGWDVAFGFPKKYVDQLQDAWKKAASSDLCTGPSDLSFEIAAANGLIKVALQDLIRKKKQGGCYLDVDTVDDSLILFGSKGFQHYYISANFEEQTISFAKKVDTTDSNIVAV